VINPTDDTAKLTRVSKKEAGHASNVIAPTFHRH